MACTKNRVKVKRPTVDKPTTGHTLPGQWRLVPLIVTLAVQAGSAMEELLRRGMSTHRATRPLLLLPVSNQARCRRRRRQRQRQPARTFLLQPSLTAATAAGCKISA